MRTARSIAGWTQDELGLKSGLKRTYIGAIERGDINPGIDNVDRIANAFGVSSHVLLLTPPAAHSALFAVLNTQNDVEANGAPR